MKHAPLLRLVVAGLLLSGSSAALAQSTRVQDLERRVAQLEALVAKLQGAPAQTTVAPIATTQPSVGVQPVLPARAADAEPIEPTCFATADAAGRFLANAGDYAGRCLDVDATRDLTFTGVAQGSDRAALLASLTVRRLHNHEDGRVHNTYHRGRFGLTKAKENDRFPIFDVAAGQWLRGWGLTGGYEFGRTQSRTVEDATKLIAAYLDSARKDCVNELSAVGVRKADTGKIVLADRREIAERCDGEQLTEWMRDGSRRKKYYDAFSAAVFRPEKVRAAYGGLNGSVAFPRFEYVPLANLPSGPVTGQPSEPTALKVDKTSYELRAYAGGYTTEHFAMELGLSHRRTFEQSSKSTICPVGTTGYLNCFDIRTVAPSELRGVVADLRLALELNFPLISKLGIVVTPSYEFDANRWNANGALFFAVDDSGKLTSGLSARCKGKGVDRGGKALKEDCKAEVFISTSFSVRPPK